ncbi:hypothetical protein H8B15_19705 [Hymenobacter sp. BT507]|uniref:STAS/SEC14 domain-containing protein n=1 Tax=Hymenobacter citatus TaxID=2763506 RepID=A0ABR7MPZ7_9BACT|nr:hypothetical protein [Hymenobacter citatus]MBC6613157.1 hypothetical protein [Hymenobacter citatus]
MPHSIQPIYFENAVGRITEHAAGYALVRYHPVKREPAELRALLTHLGNLLLRRNWQRILVDMQAMEPLSTPEKMLLMEEWYGGHIPRPERLCTAYVLAEKALTRLSIYELQQEARKHHSSNAFTSLDEAHAYLLTYR